MLPYSLFIGAKSNSSASVAALMYFIVTIGVRKIANPAASAASSKAAGAFAAREMTMHGMGRSHRVLQTLLHFVRRQDS
jgi:hypothetical protein